MQLSTVVSNPRAEAPVARPLAVTVKLMVTRPPAVGRLPRMSRWQRSSWRMYTPTILSRTILGVRVVLMGDRGGRPILTTLLGTFSVEAIRVVSPTASKSIESDERITADTACVTVTGTARLAGSASTTTVVAPGPTASRSPSLETAATDWSITVKDGDASSTGAPEASSTATSIRSVSPSEENPRLSGMDVIVAGICSTTTSTDAVAVRYDPHTVVTPFPTAVTTPAESTLATDGSSERHVGEPDVGRPSRRVVAVRVAD